jgi:hypothetical protein
MSEERIIGIVFKYALIFHCMGLDILKFLQNKSCLQV